MTGLADPFTPQPLTTGAGRRRRFIAGVLIILALAFLAYRPVLPGNFIMDDRRLIETDNPLVNGELHPASIWFQTDFSLSTFAMWVEWTLFGSHPGPYHAVNILLQALGAILLWRVLCQFNVPGCWMAGALFAVHPVCVNSVARLAEIKNTLSLPFFLLSIGFYFSKWKYRDALALVMFILALMAKTSTIMLPIVLLCLVAWQNRRVNLLEILRATPFFFVALGFGLMSIWFQKHQAITGTPLPAESFVNRFATAGRILWFYLGKAFWPTKLNLVYPEWNIEGPSFGAFLPWVLLFVLGLVAWWDRRGWGRHVLLALGVYAITLFPALGFFASQFLTKWRVSDHLQYLPLTAPVSLIAAGLASLRPRFIFRAISGFIVIVMAVLCFHRASVFASEERLFEDTLAKNPRAWGTENDLGVIMARKGNYRAAVEHFLASLRIKPDNADAQSNLGQALAAQGRFNDAEPYFVTALKIQPNDPETRRRYARDLMGEHRFDEAVQQMRLALSLSPKPEIRTRLDFVNLLHQTGNLHEAVDQLRYILKLSPDCTEALNNLAWMLATSPDAKLRDGPAAVQLALHATHLPPVTNMCVLGTLAAAYAESGQYSNAVATAQKALEDETAAGNGRFAEMNRILLKYYKAGKPFHEPAQK